MVRPFCKYIQENLAVPLVGAEVGVYDGRHAEVILWFLDMAMLYLVDPYAEYIEYVEGRVVPQSELDKAEENMIARLKPFEGKLKFMRMESTEAAKLLGHVKLDFAYIDANHSQPSVEQDINTWFPLIKKGGVLCGHDYDLSEVRMAVKAFVETHPPLTVISSEIDWMVVRNDT